MKELPSPFEVGFELATFAHQYDDRHHIQLRGNLWDKDSGYFRRVGPFAAEDRQHRVKQLRIDRVEDTSDRSVGPQEKTEISLLGFVGGTKSSQPDDVCRLITNHNVIGLGPGDLRLGRQCADRQGLGRAIPYLTHFDANPPRSFRATAKGFKANAFGSEHHAFAGDRRVAREVIGGLARRLVGINGGNGV